jgi:DNA-binding response OmpR family regulator
MSETSRRSRNGVLFVSHHTTWGYRETLREYLHRYQPPDFRIDTRSHTATLRGESLELTGEEFDVLVFLTSNPQRVVTPQTNLATHWTGTRIQQTNFLKGLLSLRKKLEMAAAGQQYLRTEPWVIYRFDPVPPTTG